MTRLLPDLPDIEPGERRTLGDVPAGATALVLAALSLKSGARGLLHVAADDLEAALLADAIAFFAPKLEIIAFPAWDCLPYDRVSPQTDVMAARLAALDRLLAPRTTPFVLLTTASGIQQKVLPRGVFADGRLIAGVGETLPRARLLDYLAANAYVRAETVREAGEYAVRGDIVDLFPPGAAEPLRLDFFDEQIERIRRFDAISQRTTGEERALRLLPAAEAILNEATIARFRSGYRELFGVAGGRDPLYEAVSEGRKFAGSEHWLPLFHGAMETLFDYAPDAVVTFAADAAAALAARMAQVQDFYEARKALIDAATPSGKKKTGQDSVKAAPYRPLPQSMLYLDEKALGACLARRKVWDLSPFAPASDAGASAGLTAGHDFAPERAVGQMGANIYGALVDHANAQMAAGRRVLLALATEGTRERWKKLLAEHGLAQADFVDDWAGFQSLPLTTLALAVLPLGRGFTDSGQSVVVIAEEDVLGDRMSRPKAKKRRAKSDAFTIDLGALSPGDLVVHVDHGIGRYEGLEAIAADGARHDCLRLAYDGGLLFLPVENLDLLSRYGNEAAGALDKIGGAAWQGRKARVKKRLRDMAEALLKIAAERELRDGQRIETESGAYQEFAARFPYPETEDQANAIAQVLEDLSSGRPMDRLVCGDVGFGKTEVALRAAFAAAAAGLQVAVVAPTTLLARQHMRTFRQRFAGLPIRTAQLSRLVTAKEAAATKAELADGKVDIVIGTHALLSSNVKFSHLGLVIIDEEQRFGVKQKERLKQLKADVHVLTLTATPIPRTLQMAVAGVRELSLIMTPPVDRLAVRTAILPFDPVVIRDGLMREHWRGGQSFYVCPRIEDLAKLGDMLRDLTPELRFVAAHGRMSPTEIESVMSAFDAGEYDILLATDIIESGLDIPRANTIVVHRADLFGLAQLYQLRGRVGRAKQRGYAYFTWPADTILAETATRRLEVMQTLDHLGAGFQLASHDLDIRGAGNLLGEEQSGHIREVGVELYQQMLQEAIAAVRGGGNAAAGDMGDGSGEAGSGEWSPQISLGIPVLIPESYVADLHVRLGLYRQIARLQSAEEIEAFAAELIDRFGPLPGEVENLLSTVRIKQLCRQAGIERLDVGPKGAVIGFHRNSFAKPDRLIAYMQRHAGVLRLRPDHKLVSLKVWEQPDTRFKGAEKLVRDLAELAA